jgi:RimJ/RimL family protein N-acetyltransferase
MVDSASTGTSLDRIGTHRDDGQRVAPQGVTTMESVPVPRTPLLTIVGQRVALGPMRRELLPLYARWSNDFAVTRTMRASTPMTLDRLEADFAHAVADEASVSFTIYDRESGQPIGNTAWIDIDHRARTAEFILYIGEAPYRGRGLGSEVTRLMLAYAFTTLGLHNVILRVYAFNIAGQRAYAHAGFRECGRRREAKVLGGQFWDVVYMECLATEWKANEAD